MLKSFVSVGYVTFFYCHCNASGKLYSIKFKGSNHSLKKLTINVDLTAAEYLYGRNLTEAL